MRLVYFQSLPEIYIYLKKDHCNRFDYILSLFSNQSSKLIVTVWKQRQLYHCLFCINRVNIKLTRHLVKMIMHFCSSILLSGLKKKCLLGRINYLLSSKKDKPYWYKWHVDLGQIFTYKAKIACKFNSVSFQNL